MNKRKRVIVIRYLGWLLMVALLSMVAIALFVKVKIWIIISSIITALLGCVFLFLRFCYRINGWFKSQYEKIYKAFWKRCRDVCEKWMVRAESKNSYKDEIELLSPKTHEKSRYVEILKSAVDNPNVKNIAISGPYGSGKSTIIASFENIFPKYKCLNLSLAAFAEECQGQQTEYKEQKSGVDEKENDEDQGQGSEDNALYPNSSPKGNHSQSENESSHVKYNTISMAELEYSLVQQFFYHVKASKIPESRFGRIHRWNKCHKLLWSIFAFFYFLIVVLCFCKSLCDDTPILSLIPNDVDWNKAYYIAFIISSFFILYCVVGLIHRIKSANVKVMDYEMSFNKDEKISVFNHYLDELVYLFQTTGYEIVVLEDLDRFRNTSIFTKLRELNQLLNQAQDINRRIVFIYALRDDIFQDSKERTKFFDFIIPIIPYVNVANSADQFVKYFNPHINEGKTDLHLNTLIDIAPFVSDLRTIKAIASDFKIRSKELKIDLYKDNLLALSLYKNLCPQDFDSIYEGEGPIKEIFNKKHEYISEQKQIIQEKITSLLDQIGKIRSERLENVSELNLLLIGALARCVPQNHILCNSNGDPIESPSFDNEKGIQGILDGSYYYKQGWQTKRITPELISKMLPPNFNYQERREWVEKKANSELEKLEKHIRGFKDDLFELDSLTMKELCEKYPNVLKNEKYSPLLIFLVSRGYIDEQYQYYFTVYEEKIGLLSTNDREYVMSLKNIGTNDEEEFGRKIDNPQSALRFLQEQDYRSVKILNFDLVHEIIKSNDIKKAEWIVKRIENGDTVALDFVQLYPYPEDGLISKISDSYDRLWIDFLSDSLFSNESVLILFERIIKYASVPSIKNMNVNDELKEYLETYGNLMDISAVKAIQIIKALNPHFKNLYDDRNGNNLIEFVVKNNYYQINSNNIILIINTLGTKKNKFISGAYYSTILEANIPFLIKRVEDDIERFTKDVVLSLDNVYEIEDNLVTLLNNNNISLDIRKCLVERSVTRITLIEQIEALEIIDCLFDHKKVNPSLENLHCYLDIFGLKDLNDRIINHVNDHLDIYSITIESNECIDEWVLSLMCLLLQCPKISKVVWQSILDSIQYDNVWKQCPTDLRDEQITYLINKHKLAYSVNIIKELITTHKNLTELIFNSYSSEIIKTIREFDFSARFLFKMAAIPIFQDNRHLLMAEITIDKIEDEEIANEFLNYTLESKSIYRFEIFEKSLMLSNDTLLKLKAVGAYLNRGYKHPSINSFFEKLGDPFNKLNSTCKHVLFEGDYPELKDFLDLLNKKGYLGKITPKKEGFYVYVRKR